MESIGKRAHEKKKFSRHNSGLGRKHLWSSTLEVEAAANAACYLNGFQRKRKWTTKKFKPMLSCELEITES